MKIRATVEIELEAENEDAAVDIISAVWSEGDPESSYNACVYVNDTQQVEWFSWERNMTQIV